MPIDGFINMYEHDPALFWQIVYAVTPGFVAGVLYGLLVHSRELNGRTTTSRQMWRFTFLTNAASLLWIGYMTDWPLANMTIDVAALVIGLYALALMWPIVVGMMTGMRLMQAYWFLRRTSNLLRFYVKRWRRS
jgi:hypothetical protein